MRTTRRDVLLTIGAGMGAIALPGIVRAQTAHVVVVGGGFGGTTAARYLQRLNPGLRISELYPDIITHVPNARVKEVDPWNKRIMTEAGDFDFDEAIFMPPHQASDMVFHADLIGTDAAGKSTGWADMHPRLFHANSDDSVYIVGDSMGAISPHFGHYPKSGHVANYIAKIVARNIGQRVRGQEVVAELPDNLCYMLVNGEPREAISVEFLYEVGADNQVHQTQIDIDVRTPDLMKEDLVWINGMFDDFVRV